MVCNIFKPFYSCFCLDRPNPLKEKELSLLPVEEIDEKDVFLLPQRSKQLEKRNADLKEEIQVIAKLPRKTSLVDDKNSVVDSIYQGNRKACQV